MLCYSSLYYFKGCILSFEKKNRYWRRGSRGWFPFLFFNSALLINIFFHSLFGNLPGSANVERFNQFSLKQFIGSILANPKHFTYELWKKKSFKKGISKRENMIYIEEGDIYICANGRCLYPSGIRHTKTESGYISEQTFYKCEDCSGCPYAQKCKKSISEKVMRVSKKLVEKREKSYRNITSEYGTKLRMNRSIQIEEAFGVLKYDHEFNRFLTRGKNNVKTEFILLSLGYNINKLHAKIQGERCGSHLHELKKSA